MPGTPTTRVRGLPAHGMTVFRKLVISSRNELGRFLAEDAEWPATASEPAPVPG